RYPNGGFGVVITGPDNTIGGPAAGAGNVISFNGEFHLTGQFGGGIQGVGATPRGNQNQGNVIVGNVGDGVLLADQAADNLIGGAGPGAGNVIGKSFGNGIHLTQGASANRLYGNLLGLTSDGVGYAGNLGQGVLVEDASNNVIGGTDAG